MNTEELLNKKILMFGPSFFGYCDIIAEELRALGAQVDLYDERPNNGAFCHIASIPNPRQSFQGYVFALWKAWWEFPQSHAQSSCPCRFLQI